MLGFLKNWGVLGGPHDKDVYIGVPYVGNFQMEFSETHGSERHFFVVLLQWSLHEHWMGLEVLHAEILQSRIATCSEDSGGHWEEGLAHALGNDDCLLHPTS